MRLGVGGEVAVRNLSVSLPSAIADVERRCGDTVRAVARALDRAAGLSSRLGGVVHADPAAWGAPPVALGLEQREAQAVGVGADDAVVYAGTAAYVKRGSSYRVGTADAIALGAVVARWRLGLGRPLLHGAARLASLHVGRHLGFELRERASVAREVAQGVGMIGAAKADSSVVVADHAVDAPATAVEVVACPFDCFVPLLVEVGLVGCVGKLDAHDLGIAVAYAPRLAVVSHRVVDHAAVKLHDVMHRVGVPAGIELVVVPCARPRVSRLVDYQVLRRDATVTVVADGLLLRVGMRRAREHQRSAEDQRQHERRKLGKRLLLVLIHVYRRPSPR